MRYYAVDAFADKLFEGNQAGICVLDGWLDADLMQSIAAENNVPSTAFAVKEGDGYRLRWFTPGGEINLCGHATLAMGFVIMEIIEPGKTEVNFYSESGDLVVTKKQNLYEIDFPGYELKKVEVTDLMEEVTGIRPVEAWIGRDLVLVMENEEQVYQTKIDMQKVLELDGLLLHVTSKAKDYDCVTRTFSVKLGVAEDPVCGSGHCHIAPFWAERLNKNSLVARQASKRGGTLYCKIDGKRVKLSGGAVLFATSELHV